MESPLTEPLWQGAIDSFFENAEDIDISIQDFRVLSSYSWLDRPQRTIVVPGLSQHFLPFDNLGYPLILSEDPPAPFQMIPAKGTIVIDQNACRRPSCPLEPLFRAVYHTLPNFDPTGIDLVTDRNNLRKLLSAISSNGDCNENFRIDVQFLGNTMIFNRWNTSLQENIMSPRYRESFLKAITLGRSWTSSHHQIVRFSWAGLDVIERHTVDACIERIDGPTTSVEYVPPVVSSSGLTIIGRGSFVDQQDLLQFKSLESDSVIDMRRIFPRLFFSQMSSLLLGYHRYGTFERVEKATSLYETVDSEKSMKVWQEEMASELGAVVRAIRTIRHVLRESEQPWGVVIVEDRQLRIYGRQTDNGNDKAPGKLPDDLILKWRKAENVKH